MPPTQMGRFARSALFSMWVAIAIVSAGAQWKPQDVYRINCGSSSSTSVDSNGLQWQPDTPRMISTGVVASSGNSSSVIPPPYATARIFTTPSSYNFAVSPGRHWVRLHFFPFASPAMPDPAAARFSVAIGTRLLIHNTSIVDETSKSNSSSGSLVTEFSIHAASTALSITFLPTQQQQQNSSSSYAFINGIELISMAHDSISPSVVEIEPSDQAQNENRQIEISNLLTRTLYRLNVGGPLISAANDSATQGRTWSPDSPFLQGVARGAEVPPAVSDISYPSTVPEYIAPRGVYGTARSLGTSNTVANSFNLSWRFTITPGYAHYLRLHFAELVYTSPMQRVFGVYINNRTAIRALDLIQQVGSVNTPYYKDFLVMPDETLSTLRLQIGPLSGSGSQYQDAILNGLEIFRLNDSSGNVDGLAVSGIPMKPSPKSKVGVIVGSVAGALFAIVAVVVGVGFFCFCNKDKSKQNSNQNHKHTPSSWHPLAGNSHSVLSSTLGGGSPRSGAGSYYNAASLASHGRYFSFQEIVDATNGFDESRLLGVGGFGRVYKGELDNGTLEVAVKRGNPRSEQGIAEFQAEIDLLSKLRHRHLVSLIGYCDEQSEMILVYEFMARGPLRGHLYGTDQPPLSWRQRLEIVVGAARGLHYLHTGADHTRAIIHRDVKTTNILLDEQLLAKVSDFGLSKTGPMLDQTHVSTAVKGSFGYLDPEYFRRQQLTDKSDVYSFGVVLVEVMCARPAIDPGLPREQVNIAEWAMHAQRNGRLEQILDPELRRRGTEDEADMESIRKVGETAEKCLQEQGVQRPSMGDVLWNLESALHMQEAAERRYRNADGGNANVGPSGGNGNNAAGSMVVEMSNRGGASANSANPANPVNPVAHAPAASSNLYSNQPGMTNSQRGGGLDDYYDEDASASAVFSQLVNPQGR